MTRVKGYLLDTNIVIALFFNDPIVSTFARKAVEDKVPLLCSVITECEVLTKMTELEFQRARLFNAKQCLEVSRTVARKAGQIRREQSVKRKLKTPDAIIISTALIYDLILVSRDNHMTFIDELGIPLLRLESQENQVT